MSDLNDEQLKNMQEKILKPGISVRSWMWKWAFIRISG
jgi:hypothetical protein